MTWTMFGTVAVAAMLVSYALERPSRRVRRRIRRRGGVRRRDRGPPFAVLEAVWAVVALTRWWRDGEGA